MTDSLQTLSALRRQIATLADTRLPAARGHVASGHAPFDQAMGGGLARGRVHELFGAEPEDAGSATGFALLLALLAGEGTGAPLLWLRTDGAGRCCGMPYGPGLLELGISPERMLIGVMRDEAMLLRAAADALRCKRLGAVVVECWGNPRILDLTASRRLALAAEGSGVTAMLVRLDARPTPSAAETRWQVMAAPSAPIAGTPGASAFDIMLMRRRAGPDGQRWRLEWNRDRRCFTQADEQALPGAVVPVPAAGPAADRAAGPVGIRTG